MDGEMKTSAELEAELGERAGGRGLGYLRRYERFLDSWRDGALGDDGYYAAERALRSEMEDDLQMTVGDIDLIDALLDRYFEESGTRSAVEARERAHEASRGPRDEDLLLELKAVHGSHALYEDPSERLYACDLDPGRVSGYEGMSQVHPPRVLAEVADRGGFYTLADSRAGEAVLDASAHGGFPKLLGYGAVRAFEEGARKGAGLDAPASALKGDLHAAAAARGAAPAARTAPRAKRGV